MNVSCGCLVIIQFENENENVKLGKMLDESSYGRNEKHVMLDNVVNLDMLEDWSIYFSFLVIASPIQRP